jgi:uncharacterized protein involved in response to NO
VGRDSGKRGVARAHRGRNRHDDARRDDAGRPLTSDAATTSAYLLVTAGAALRVASGLLLPETGATLLSFAGIAWIAAFATFVVAYARPLTMPRLRASDCAAPG